MSARFTDQARRVMQLAEQEARRFQQEYVGTEHILLGILREGSNLASRVLNQLGIELRHVRLQVEMVAQPGTRPADKALPLTPRVGKVTALAGEEAARLGHDFYVGPEHLLLGLLREEDCVAVQVLLNLGMRSDRVRAATLADPDLSAVQQPAPRGITATPPAQAPSPDSGEDNITRSAQVDSLRPTQQANPVPPLIEQSVTTPDLNRPVTRPGGCLLHGWYLFLWLFFGYKEPLSRDHAEEDVDSPTGMRFTSKTREVLRLAKREARQLHHESLGTEHLLLGIVREGTSTAAKLLDRLGANIYTVRQEVLKRAQPGAARPVMLPRLPATENANAALRVASEEARALGKKDIGTEHLLLGLVGAGRGLAAEVLEHLGVTAERVRLALRGDEED